MPTMNQNKSAQTFKILQGKITEQSRFVSFVSKDSDTDICRLNHVDIIASITDCETAGVWLVDFPKGDD